MSYDDFMDDLEELVSAEDFLDYFAIPYEARVVQVNRLHILQRFHDYLHAYPLPTELEALKAAYVNALTNAYQSFVNSDARTEAVLKIYQRQAGVAFVSADSLLGKGA